MKNIFILLVILLCVSKNYATEDTEEADLSDIGAETEEYNPEKFLALIRAQKKDPEQLLKLMLKWIQEASFQELATLTIPIVVKWIKHEDPAIQYQAIRVLSRFAEVKSEQIEEDAILNLVPLLRSKDEKIVQETLHALANIVAGNPKLRDFFLKHGIDKQLFKFFNDPKASIEILREVVSVTKSICLEENLADRFVDRILIVYDYLLIRHSDPEILSNITWGFALLTRKSISHPLFFDILKINADLLHHDDEQVLLGSVTAITNTIFDETKTEEMRKLIANGLLKSFPKLLKHFNSVIIDKTLVIVAHIVQQFPTDSSIIFKAKLIPLIIENLSHESYKVQENAALSIISVLAFANSVQTSNLIDMNVIPALCNVLISVEKRNSENMFQPIIGSFALFYAKTPKRTKEINEMLHKCGAIPLIYRQRKHLDKGLDNSVFEIFEKVLPKSYKKLEL